MSNYRTYGFFKFTQTPNWVYFLIHFIGFHAVSVGICDCRYPVLSTIVKICFHRKHSKQDSRTFERKLSRYILTALRRHLIASAADVAQTTYCDRPSSTVLSVADVMIDGQSTIAFLLSDLFQVGMLLLIMVIPLTIMSFAYSSICRELWMVASRRQQMTAVK